MHFFIEAVRTKQPEAGIHPIMQDAINKYFEDDQLKSSFCNTDNFWPPLILFPDLTSDYYKEILVDEEKGWFSAWCTLHAQ